MTILKKHFTEIQSNRGLVGKAATMVNEVSPGVKEFYR